MRGRAVPLTRREGRWRGKKVGRPGSSPYYGIVPFCFESTDEDTKAVNDATRFPETRLRVKKGRCNSKNDSTRIFLTDVQFGM